MTLASPKHEARKRRAEGGPRRLLRQVRRPPRAMVAYCSVPQDELSDLVERSALSVYWKPEGITACRLLENSMKPPPSHHFLLHICVATPPYALLKSTKRTSQPVHRDSSKLRKVSAKLVQLVWTFEYPVHNDVMKAVMQVMRCEYRRGLVGVHKITVDGGSTSFVRSASCNSYGGRSNSEIDS